jgi:hypothetical protein
MVSPPSIPDESLNSHKDGGSGLMKLSTSPESLAAFPEGQMLKHNGGELKDKVKTF